MKMKVSFFYLFCFVISNQLCTADVVPLPKKKKQVAAEEDNDEAHRAQLDIARRNDAAFIKVKTNVKGKGKPKSAVTVMSTLTQQQGVHQCHLCLHLHPTMLQLLPLLRPATPLLLPLLCLSALSHLHPHNLSFPHRQLAPPCPSPPHPLSQPHLPLTKHLPPPPARRICPHGLSR